MDHKKEIMSIMHTIICNNGLTIDKGETVLYQIIRVLEDIKSGSLRQVMRETAVKDLEVQELI